MKTRIAAAVALVCIVAVTLMLRGGPAPRPAAGPAKRGLRVRWPAGTKLAFSVSWRGKTGGEIAPGPDGKTSQAVALEASTKGEIALERVPGPRQVVALSWTRIDELSFTMQGQDAAGDTAEARKALTAQPAFLEVDDRGRIGEIAFAPEMSPSARAILRSLALELRYTLPQDDAAEWRAVEHDSLGEVELAYRAAGSQLVREPVAYQRLDAVSGRLDGKQEVKGGAVIALDADGVALSIEETQGASYTRPSGTTPAVVSEWTFVLHRIGEAAGTPSLAAAASRARSQPLAAQVDDPDRQKRRDQRMAEGMSLDALALAVERFERGTKPGQFLVKAAAWLRLHPEDLPEMVARFRSSELTLRGRGLILDVLAETGTPQAQKAMRDALNTGAARSQPRDFSILVQRFTFVIAPDRDSVDFLQREYDVASQGGKVTEAQGTAVALGSTVRRLDDQREHERAKEVNERLRAGLRSADSPEMRAALVAALGNAAHEEDVPDILTAAADSDVRVRGQVAAALRTVDSPQARAGLLSLATDQSSAVARSAFASLGKQTLQDDDWRALRDLALDAKQPPAADAALVDLVRQKGKARAEGRDILVKLLERNQSADSDLGGIIRGLLKESQGG